MHESKESKKVRCMAEIEVEKYQPKYYDIMPEKFTTHIFETPKLRKVDYKVINSSTPKKENGEISKEVLQAANLIRHHHCDPEVVRDLSSTEKTFVKNDNVEISKEVLHGANLIRDHHCDPEVVLELSSTEKTFLRSPSCKSVDDKFVVNLFESRQSKRWKRRGICLPNGALESLITTTPSMQEPESHKTVSREKIFIIITLCLI